MVSFLPVEPDTDRQDALGFWGLGACAILFCVASAFSYLFYMGQGMVVGDLLGLRGREADVAIAQRSAVYWLWASVGCLAGSGIAGALATPIYKDAPCFPRFIARLVVASVVSFLLVVLILFASFSIITTAHHSAVR